MEAKRLWWSFTVVCLSILGMFVCLLLAMALAMPWMVSTNWGRQALVEQINTRIPGEVRLGGLELGWLSPCRLEGFALLDSNEEPIAQFDRLESSAGLLEMIQRTSIEEARLTGGSLRLEVDRRGVSSLERALGMTPSPACRSPRIDHAGLAAELDHVEVEWSSKRGQGIFVSSALCRQGQVQGSWRVDATFQEGALQSWEAEVDQVPTEIFDSLLAVVKPSLRGTLKTLIGDPVTLRSNGQGTQSLQGKLELSSSTLDARLEIFGTLKDPMARLVAPASLRVEKGPLQRLLRMQLGAQAPLVKSDLRVMIPEITWESKQGPRLLAHLAAPLEAGVQQHLLRLAEWELAVQREHELWSITSRLEGMGDSQPWSCEGALQLAPLKGVLKGSGLPTWIFEVGAAPGVVRRLIGGEKIAFEGSVDPGHPNPWSLRATVTGSAPSAFGLPLVLEGRGFFHERSTGFEIETSAPRLEIRTAGTWVPDQEVELKASTGLVRWNQAFLGGLGFQGLPGLGKQMVPIRLSMDPLTIDLCRGGLPVLRAKLEAAAFDLEQLKNPIQVQHLEGRLALHPTDERASLQLTADLHVTGQPKTSIALSGTARELGKTPSFEGRLDCPSLPLGLVEVLAPQTDGLDEVLGQSLAVQADLLSTGGGTAGSLDVQISGSNLQLQLPLAWQDGWSLLPSRSAQLSLKLNPQQLQAAGRWLPALHQLTLLQPLVLAAECSSLEWTPTSEPLPAIAGALKLQPLSVGVEGRSEPLAIPTCNLLFTQDPNRLLTRGTLEAEIELDQELGSIQASAAWDRTAAWNTFSVTADVAKLPAALIEGLLGHDQGSIEALLGPRLNGRFSLASQEESAKSWIVQGRSMQAGLSASGWLRRDGSLGLSTPLLLGWTVPASLQQAQLGTFTPLAAALVPGQTMAASIQPEGFRFSWKAPSLETLSMGRSVFDVGKVTFQDSQFLNDMETFLKKQDGQRRETLWLTPVYFSIKADTLTLDRVDFLVNNSFPVVLWGDVGLSSSALAMTLGFPSETLAGFLQNPIGSEGLFTLDLTGTVENPKVDWTGAAARLAVSAASKLNVGTLVLGSLASRLLTKGVPAPTTQPFPWKAPERPALKEKLLRQLDRELSDLPAAN